MRQFNKARIFLDEDFTAVDKFTVSFIIIMYFIMCCIYIYIYIYICFVFYHVWFICYYIV